MAVTLKLARTKNGTAVNDTLAGGGSGIDFGNVINGSYAGVVDKPTNTHNDNVCRFFLSHNATIDPITEVKFYMAAYHLTYGGALSAALDYASASHGMTNIGLASGSSKNNNDNLSGGLWLDMDWDVTVTNQFDYATRVNNVRIFGKPLSGVTGSMATPNAGIGLVNQNGQDGTNLAEAFFLNSDACLYSSDDNTNETAPTAPVHGRIGKQNDTALGDFAKLLFRVYLPGTYPDGGIIQFTNVISFSFTA